eukprot:1161828-Pelagomonas_calceolata.AAC.9
MRAAARLSLACTAASTRYTTFRAAAGGESARAGGCPGPWTEPVMQKRWTWSTHVCMCCVYVCVRSCARTRACILVADCCDARAVSASCVLTGGSCTQAPVNFWCMCNMPLGGPAARLPTAGLLFP